MADTYFDEKDLGRKSSLSVNDFIRIVGTDNASYKQLISDVAKAIIENYSGSNVAGSNQSVKAALDSLNSNVVYSGTTSFAAIDPVHPNVATQLGGMLDAKVVPVVSSLPTGVNTIHGANNGPTFGVILDKTGGDTYYSGIVWTYHADYGNTPWYFAYRNGTYILRPVSVRK